VCENGTDIRCRPRLVQLEMIFTKFLLIKSFARVKVIKRVDWNV
jgi:hypothetical protein